MQTSQSNIRATWDEQFRSRIEVVQEKIDDLRIKREDLFEDGKKPDPSTLEQLEKELDAAKDERHHIAWERHQEGLRIGAIEPMPTLQEIARRNVQNGRAYVVTLLNGEQFLTPNIHCARETADVRGGCVDPASIFKVPGELYGQYRWRPNYKYDTPWRDWPEWSDTDTEKARSDEPLTMDELSELETEGHGADMLLEGWLTAAGVHPIVGDSGLGKTPLLLQLAACVASGRDFLGIPTSQGKVLICDYENFGSLTTKLQEVSKAISADYDTEVKPNIECFTSPTQEQVLSCAKRTRYALIIVDALRGFIGGDDKDGKAIVPTFTKMSKIPSCWVAVHHIRKRDRQNPPPDLTDMNMRVLEWFEEASGHRSIANQASTRMGIVAPKDGADLFIRAFVKGTGEKGPLLLERIYQDEDPERPIGYQIARDWSLLPDTERKEYQAVAGRTLSWGELKALFGKNQTTKLLEACRSANLVSETGRARHDRKYAFRPLVVETPDQAIADALGG
jgi:AAA domain-containing protein